MKKQILSDFVFLRIVMFPVFLIIGSNTGCSSLIFGNIKPFEEKSQNYSVIDISKESTSWNKLTNSQKKAELEPTEGSLGADTSDMAFLSKDTGATISLNSTCKNYSLPDTKTGARAGSNAETKLDKIHLLRKLTDELLSGTLSAQAAISPKFEKIQTFREEKELIIENTPALQTTTQGELNGQNFVIETVILQAGTCIYDMIYVARSEKFKQNEKDFARFVSSLRLK